MSPTNAHLEPSQCHIRGSDGKTSTDSSQNESPTQSTMRDLMTQGVMEFLIGVFARPHSSFRGEGSKVTAGLQIRQDVNLRAQITADCEGMRL